MDESKIIYWGLVAAMTALVPAGIWLSLFADRLLGQRAKLAEARLGKKSVAFFMSTLRILAMTVAVLALYILFNLLRILPCALK